MEKGMTRLKLRRTSLDLIDTKLKEEEEEEEEDEDAFRNLIDPDLFN
jgi:hypothetical protein